MYTGTADSRFKTNAISTSNSIIRIQQNHPPKMASASSSISRAGSSLKLSSSAAATLPLMTPKLEEHYLHQVEQDIQEMQGQLTAQRVRLIMDDMERRLRKLKVDYHEDEMLEDDLIASDEDEVEMVEVSYDDEPPVKVGHFYNVRPPSLERSSVPLSVRRQDPFISPSTLSTASDPCFAWKGSKFSADAADELEWEVAAFHMSVQNASGYTTPFPVYPDHNGMQLPTALDLSLSAFSNARSDMGDDARIQCGTEFCDCVDCLSPQTPFCSWYCNCDDCEIDRMRSQQGVEDGQDMTLRNLIHQPEVVGHDDEDIWLRVGNEWIQGE
jgi:hypothetical protein